jgi:hypothetical protein
MVVTRSTISVLIAHWSVSVARGTPPRLLSCFWLPWTLIAVAAVVKLGRRVVVEQRDVNVLRGVLVLQLQRLSKSMATRNK